MTNPTSNETLEHQILQVIDKADVASSQTFGLADEKYIAHQEVLISGFTALIEQREQAAEIALARKVLGVSSMVHKQKGVTQSMRLKHLTKEMLKIIPDSGFITEEEQ